MPEAGPLGVGKTALLCVSSKKSGGKMSAEALELALKEGRGRRI